MDKALSNSKVAPHTNMSTSLPVPNKWHFKVSYRMSRNHVDLPIFESQHQDALPATIFHSLHPQIPHLRLTQTLHHHFDTHPPEY